MTKLQEAYTALRGAGCDHDETVEKLAVKLGVGKDTIKRTLRRAGAVGTIASRSGKGR